LNNNHLQQLK